MAKSFVEEAKNLLVCRLLHSIQACSTGLSKRSQDPRLLLLNLQLNLSSVRHLQRLLENAEGPPVLTNSLAPMIDAFSALVEVQKGEKATTALIEAYAALEPGALRARVEEELSRRLFPAPPAESA